PLGGVRKLPEKQGEIPRWAVHPGVIPIDPLPSLLPLQEIVGVNPAVTKGVTGRNPPFRLHKPLHSPDGKGKGLIQQFRMIAQHLLKGRGKPEIGRASWREREWVPGVGGAVTST